MHKLSRELSALIDETSWTGIVRTVRRDTLIDWRTRVQQLEREATPMVGISDPPGELRCPDCLAVMVKTRWECVDGSGWKSGWMCECHFGGAEA